MLVFLIDVLKIEPPNTGESTRRLGPFVGDLPGVDQSLVHLYLNTGKRSITLDIQAVEGQEIFGRLAAEADLIVESFIPGTMTNIGLGYEQLSGENPGLVITSITFFG